MALSCRQLEAMQRKTHKNSIGVGGVSQSLTDQVDLKNDRELRI